MLVRSFKCTICGSHKVNKPQGMFIYCDYCGSWMGHDMLLATREAMNVFALQNMNDPLVQQYNRVLQQSVQCAKSNDKPGFIEAMLQFHELEFKLFPLRYGPKGKQAAFRKKYLEYFKAYYNKIVNDQYFDERYINRKELFDMSRLKFTTENGVNHYEFDDAFKEMLDVQVASLRAEMDKPELNELMMLHPEGEVVKNKNLMMQFSINSMLQNFGPEIAEKSLKYLNMEAGYVEVADVGLSDFSCKVCNAALKVPKGSTKTLCEACGSMNEVATGFIACHNCGASFDPTENSACPYCGAIFMETGNLNDAVGELYKNAGKKETTKRKGFFARLFGG